MALSTEETADLNETYGLMSAEELRAQLGDDAEHDGLINAILGDGKAVEVKGGTVAADDDDTDADGEKIVPAAAAKEGEDDADDEDDDADDAPELDAKAAEAAAEVAAPGADDAAREEAAAAIPKLDLSFLDAKLNEDLTALDAAKAANLAKLMDGTMTPEDYSKAESQYMRDRDALRDDKVESAAWFTEVHAFKVNAALASGINYDTDREKADAWDDWVKRLAAKPENAGKDGKWYLEQAHKKVMAEYDIAPGVPKITQKDAKATVSKNKVAETKGRAPNLSQIPPTLGGIPAAAEADTGGDSEFAHIDRLGGMELENAIARMSADQRARYEVA